MNKGDKLTLVIAHNHAIDLINAADQSIWSGYRLNRFMTIRCSSVSNRVHDFISHYRQQVDEWFRRRGIPFTYIYVLEHPRGRGLHLHLAFHLPPELKREFTNQQRAWLTAAGATWSQGLIRSKWVRPPKRFLDKYPKVPPYKLPRHLQTLGLHFLIVFYFLKGSDRRTCKQFGIDFKDQGWVKGKRVGFSKNLGPTARTRVQTVFEFAFLNRIIRRRRRHFLLDYPVPDWDDGSDDVL